MIAYDYHLPSQGAQLANNSSSSCSQPVWISKSWWWVVNSPGMELGAGPLLCQLCRQVMTRHHLPSSHSLSAWGTSAEFLPPGPTSTASTGLSSVECGSACLESCFLPGWTLKAVRWRHTALNPSPKSMLSENGILCHCSDCITS